MASGDMGAVVAPRVRPAKLGTCLRVVSSNRLRCALRGPGRGPSGLHIVCWPYGLALADRSVPGCLISHLEIPSSEVLGETGPVFEFLLRQFSRLEWQEYDIYIYIFTYTGMYICIHIYIYMCPCINI